MKVKTESEATQSCLILSNPMDCSLPVSSVHGIFQARVLEWGAIAFSVSHTIVPIIGGLDGKSICLQCGRPGFNPWVRKIPWRRKWQPTPVFLPEKSHG